MFAIFPEIVTSFKQKKFVLGTICGALLKKNSAIITFYLKYFIIILNKND